MENTFNYTELKNAVINDLKMNGVFNLEKDEYPKICDYLWNGYHAPVVGVSVAWNTAQSLFENLYEWEDDIVSGNIEKIATDIARYIEESLCVHSEELDYCEDDEVESIEGYLDYFIGCCNSYISDINKKVLFNEVYSLGMTETVYNNIINKCRKDFGEYDNIMSEYTKKYDYDFGSDRVKNMVMNIVNY